MNNDSGLWNKVKNTFSAQAVAPATTYTVAAQDKFELDIMIDSPEFHSFGAYVALPDCLDFEMIGDAMVYVDGDLFSGKQFDFGIRRQTNSKKAYVSKALHAGQVGEFGPKKVITISLIASGEGAGQISLEDVKTRKYGATPGDLISVPTQSSGLSIVFQASSIPVATVTVILRKL